MKSIIKSQHEWGLTKYMFFRLYPINTGVHPTIANQVQPQSITELSFFNQQIQ